MHKSTLLHKHQFYRPWAIQLWQHFNVLYNHRRAVIFSIMGINTNQDSSHRAHSMNSRFNSVCLSSKTLVWKIGWSASASCTKISSCQIHLSPEHYYKQIISLTFHNRDIQWTAWAGNQQRGKTWYRIKEATWTNPAIEVHWDLFSHSHLNISTVFTRKENGVCSLLVEISSGECICTQQARNTKY